LQYGAMIIYPGMVSTDSSCPRPCHLSILYIGCAEVRSASISLA